MLHSSEQDASSGRARKTAAERARELAREHEAEREEAIDDSVDADPREVKSQQEVAFHRRESVSRQERLASRLPFRYSPLFRPLTISDLDSCVALEAAAFKSERHRATPEKVRWLLRAPFPGRAVPAN